VRSSAVAEDLGRLEREALEDALRARGLVVDPAPEGKTIGQIQVVNQEVFSERDWSAGWSFGAAGGLMLYPLALGVGRFDPYEWGWRFSPLFVIIAVLSSWLIWKNNRFGLLLLVAVIAFHLHLLESSNYWDYLLDPIFGFASMAALARRGFSAFSRPRPQPEPL